MNVYIVTYCDFDGEDICGVFATKELAEKYIEKQGKKEKRHLFCDEYKVREA